ncbi:alpha/beta-hydrolase, partial [Mycena rebaudengoi]
GLPPGIESRILTINDLQMHILEAVPAHTGPAEGKAPPPLVVLLHGFPEIAYSWRKVMGPLSAAGYHVVAPDQRGYGRTIQNSNSAGAIIKYEDDLNPFRMTNLVKDVVALVPAGGPVLNPTLGYESVTAVVGHDFGSSVAGFCALIRPDIFKSVVLMSAPFPGVPKPAPAGQPSASFNMKQVDEALATLDPPRKHYMMYYSTPDKSAHMIDAPGGLHAFLREYYHVKSADWDHNEPHPLAAPQASVMAELPRYYIILMHETMPESVHGFGPTADEIKKNRWLPDEELGVYVREYRRTGLRGGLNHYRILTDPAWTSDREVFAGKQIDVPAMFVAGKQDWGTYQFPGLSETMRTKACKYMDEGYFVLIDGAGHWVQQEKSDAVVEQLLRFFKKK